MTNTESAARLTHHFEQALARALESITGRQFSITQETPAEIESFTDAIVWQQLLSLSANAAIWIAAARELWTITGRVTREAAGVAGAEIGDHDCRSAWSEICVQSMTAMAAAIAADCGREAQGFHSSKASAN